MVSITVLKLIVIMRKNNPEAKNRILDAAIKIFAEKSFEGARVDEIAKEASVPKSLIYYHFESKVKILEVLIEKFLAEYKELLNMAQNDNHQTKAENMSERISNSYTRFYEKNSDLIRIIFIESLKKSAEKPILFKILEALIKKEESFNIINKTENYNKEERRIAEFFTNLVPNFAFACFKESWTRNFEIENENLDNIFHDVFMQTHGAYHKNHK